MSNGGGGWYGTWAAEKLTVAIHILTLLAMMPGEALTSEFIAGSVNTNPVVIRRLLLALQAARLVETRKGGTGGGTRLSRSPGRIHLADVYRAVEAEEAFTMPRSKPNAECPVGQCIQAELRKVFFSVQHALERELGKTTLGDVLAAVKACCSTEPSQA